MIGADAFRNPAEMGELSERETRVHLAALYRLVAQFGWTDLVQTHISARVTGEPGHFLINPYGLMFHEITASSLVKIDYDGELVEDSPYPVNKAGFIIHSAIHRARRDVNCVLHTHTRAGVAVACQREGLLPMSQHSLILTGKVAYHDYEGVSLDTDEQKRLVADLGGKRAMILRNHGLLSAGRTIPEAFETMYYLEMSCRIQIDAMTGGQAVILPPPEIAKKAAAQYDTYAHPIGMRVWPGLLRSLDAKDPSYKE
jgi:ribulose-5-phosphate 4-epimerase/fuculose-1-phosphate aldolase